MKTSAIVLLVFGIIAIVAVISCISVQIANENKRKDSYNWEDKDTVVQTLYQMMKDVDEVLGDAGVPYAVESGTLLGCVRHGGLIPWDDDIDIQIRKEDEGHFMATWEQLVLLGYDVVHMGFGYKIFPANGKRFRQHNFRYPGLDVFITHFDGDGNTRNANHSFAKCFFAQGEYYPLRRYKFGPITVSGPADPGPFLNRCYGDDWNTVKYRVYDHATESNTKDSRREPLSAADRLPSLPKKTLEDRFF